MRYRDLFLRLYLMLFAVLAFAQAGYAQQVIFVKASATGANDGSSWQDAFTQLQPAIDAATAADQIWVAGGTYFPTQQRIAGVNRSRSFVIPSSKDGLRLFGGFAGTETQLSQRVNPQAHVSRLSGDMNQADMQQDIYIDSDRIGNTLRPETLQPIDHIRVNLSLIRIGFVDVIGIADDSNVFSVLALGSGITRQTVIDGFTVSGGHTGQQNLELFFDPVSFQPNPFYTGGGLNCDGCSAILRNMRFEGNYAMSRGGGASVYAGGNPLFVNTVFYGNVAGGALPGPPLDRPLFQYIFQGQIFSFDSSIVSNDNEGGALYVAEGSSAEVVSSTFFGNLSWNTGNHVYASGTVHIRNSILWGREGLNHPENIYSVIYAGSGTVLNSILEANCSGGIACDQNSLADPLLDAALRITDESSPAVGFGNVAAIPSDIDDLNGNGNTTEPLPYDAAGNPRIVSGTTDAGAFQTPFGGINASPAAASPGQQVELSFPAANTTTGVLINGLPALNLTALAANRIRFTIPEGATTGLLDIVTPDQTFSTAEPLVVTPASGGRALRANGSGYVEIPVGSDFAIANGFSVSFWIRATNTNVLGGEIISRRTTEDIVSLPSGSSIWALEWNDNLVRPFRFRGILGEEGNSEIVPAGEITRESFFGEPTAFAEWQHITLNATPINTAGRIEVRVFVSDVLFLDRLDYDFFDTTAATLRIGNGTGYEIDNVMYWNRALSEAELSDLRRRHLKLSPFDPEADGLIASYRFDADSPTTVFDYAGRRNGTIIGGITRSAFSGAAVATTLSNPAGPAGARITLSTPEYRAFSVGEPYGALVPGTQPGEGYGFDAVGVQHRRSPVSWVVLAGTPQPTAVTLDYSAVAALSGSDLHVIHRIEAGRPWYPAPGNWVHDPAQRTFSRDNTGFLLPGEYSITDVGGVSLTAFVRPHAQHAGPGEPVQFVVGLKNTGTDPLSAASAFELNFQGLENISVSGGSLSGSTWTVSSVDAGATQTLQVTATRSADPGPAGLSYSAVNPVAGIRNAAHTAQVFDPVYETGQHIDFYASAAGGGNTLADPGLMGILDSDFTVEAWVKRRVNFVVANDPILSQIGFGSLFSNVLRIGLINGHPVFSFNGSQLTANNPVQADSSWHHIAFTFSKQTGARTIFVDGVQTASDVNVTGPVVLNTPITLTMAANQVDSQGRRVNLISFQDKMHNLRIWDVALTREEILERMHRHISPDDPLSQSLTADFRITEGQGPLLFDYAGSQRVNFIDLPAQVWKTRGGVLFGQQNAVATQDTPAAVGLPGASLTVSGVSEREVLLHLSGQPDGPDRTPADTGESFAETFAGFVTGRPNVTWSLSTTPGDTLQADLELAYGALSLSEEPAERLFVLYRTGPDQDWDFDEGWNHHPDTKTFTRSGDVLAGEYSIISIPTARLAIETEILELGDPDENGFRIRLTATNTGLDTPAQTTVATLASRTGAFLNLQAEGNGFDTETLSWNVPDLGAGQSVSVILSGTFNDNIPVALSSEITGTEVFNLSTQVQRTAGLILAKAPYAAGSTVAPQFDLLPGVSGTDFGLVNSSFTVEAWVRPNTISGDQAILGQAMPGNPDNRTLHLILRNGRVHMGFFGDDLQGQTDVPAQQWSHVAFTYDVTTNSRVVYLNGVADGSDTSGGPFLGEGTVFIGRWNDGNFLNGQFDELRIWNRVRSPEEIRQNMHRTISQSEPDFQDLTAYYRFDEGEGTIAHDLRGGFHATIAGSLENAWQISAAPVGQQAVVVTAGTAAQVGVAGSSLGLSGLTGSDAGLYSFGLAGSDLRTAANAGGSFSALEDQGIDARTSVGWGVRAGDDSEGTLTLTFDGFDAESPVLQSPGLLYRPAADQPWELQSDSLWVKSIAQNTFTFTGELASGEYVLAPFPFLNAPYAGTTPGWRMVGAPGAFARYDNVLADIWTQGFPGASAGDDGDPNVFIYDEGARSWVPPASATNILGTTSDTGFRSAGRTAIVYFFEDQLPFNVRYAGLFNAEETELTLPATVLTEDDGFQGWHLVSNPFPFPIDWTRVVADGLNEVAPPIFIYDADTFDGMGGYRVHYGFNIPGLPGQIQHDGIIPPFQGFFIRTAQIDGTPGTLTFRPSHRPVNGGGGGQLFRQGDEEEPEAPLHLLLSVENADGSQARSSLLKIEQTDEAEQAGQVLSELGMPASLVWG
ncbi:Concanavalin A-like lectin/glucanases superfamily protein [Cyclonatronum proteinivorum]|uniref:Concanavalin A-like lectin/glucanases superfamily protein n=1 Tax=Cyclonatronum proteinivorum TaxID=1457365 RepID=A0A345ULU9_9BACT|nr:LamG-like jellyroll fold domain-containing protein [Cyclonatronum proteinivorum]AXJ01451.1 Concanavalin A-like lectin/glucanases superfamily protein [Cyclonatronum proteinivorum]